MLATTGALPTGGGSVDLRLTETGDAYVIDVNASCYLEESGELAMAARAAGLTYVALVDRIAALARERFARRCVPVAAESLTLSGWKTGTTWCPRMPPCALRFPMMIL